MVSIIVPVYNVEKYLHRCINSVLEQTYKDWELILVDDGSSDDSGKICDDYANKDSRIRVFHKENGGVSSARNIGLDNAYGEWVTFLDSDDYISVDYLNGICDFDYDIILGCSYMIMHDGSKSLLEKLPQETIMNCNQLKAFFERNMVMGLLRAPWGKLIKRNVIGNIRFAVGQNIGEDTFFILQILRNVHSLSIDNCRVYYWQKDVVDDTHKYRLASESAVKFVGNIFSAYKALDVHSAAFEGFLLTYYFDLCNKRIAHKIWFNSPVIKELHSRDPELLPIYKVWRAFPMIAPVFEKLYVFLAKIKGNF